MVRAGDDGAHELIFKVGHLVLMRCRFPAIQLLGSVPASAVANMPALFLARSLLDYFPAVRP